MSSKVDLHKYGTSHFITKNKPKMAYSRDALLKNSKRQERDKTRERLERDYRETREKLERD